MAIARALDPIAKRRSRGPESTRSKSTHMHKNKLSEIDLRLTCRHVEALGASDLRRDLIAVDRDRDLHREALLSDLHQEASEGSPADTWTEMARSIVIKRAIAISRAIFIGRRKYYDPIATRSWSDPGAIMATITSIMVRIFCGNSPFKKIDVSPLSFFLNF